MLKKGKNGKIVMMYMDYTNEFLLPDQNLGLYKVDSFVLTCRERRKHLVGVPLRGSLATRSLSTMEKTLFQKALPSPAT
jgi:hypothetical protein